MFQSKTNPEKKFGSIFVQKRYDEAHAGDALQEHKGKERIFCMRHGQTALDDLHRSDGWIDLPLSDEGRQNVVVALADYFKKVPITCIYTSDLRRTKETAEIIKSGLSTDPKIEVTNKIKTWNLGDYAGQKKKPNKPLVKELLANPSKQAPNGESYDELKTRFDGFMHKMEKEVAKDGPILLILSGSDCRRAGELYLGDRTKLDIDEAGIFVIFKDGDKWTAECVDKHRDENDIKDNPEVS